MEANALKTLFELVGITHFPETCCKLNLSTVPLPLIVVDEVAFSDEENREPCRQSSEVAVQLKTVSNAQESFCGVDDAVGSTVAYGVAGDNQLLCTPVSGQSDSSFSTDILTKSYN